MSKPIKIVGKTEQIIDPKTGEPQRDPETGEILYSYKKTDEVAKTLTEEERILKRIRTGLNMIRNRMSDVHKWETAEYGEGKESVRVQILIKEFDRLRKRLVKFEKMFITATRWTNEYYYEWEQLMNYPNISKKKKISKHINKVLKYYQKVLGIADDEMLKGEIGTRLKFLLDSNKAAMKPYERGLHIVMKGGLKTICWYLIDLKKDILALESLSQ